MSPTQIDENALTKGQRRKLNALRKSVGTEIGEQAFAAWLASQPAAKADANAALIVDTLWPLVQQGALAIVVKHALLTPRNSARSMVYRADRHRTRAPINRLAPPTTMRAE